MFKTTSEEVEQLGDGIYDITSIEYLKLDTGDLDDEGSLGETTNDLIKDFLRKFPDAVLANAYNTGITFLLSKKPRPFSGTLIGEGFNHGSTNILMGLPKAILILAEND
jgi:hypothetical protein